jgi:hypothetical protein
MGHLMGPVDIDLLQVLCTYRLTSISMVPFVDSMDAKTGWLSKRKSLSAGEAVCF